MLVADLKAMVLSVKESSSRTLENKMCCLVGALVQMVSIRETP